MSITILVPVPTPSLNRLYGRHWSAKHRAKRQWGMLILASAQTAAVRGQNFPRARVSITRTGPRLLDYDNLVAGCKSTVIDNLVAQGYIAGDDPERLTVEYHQKVSRKGPHQTVITIERVG